MPSPPTILIVDDDDIEVTLSTIALRNLLPEVTLVVASDGMAALELLRSMPTPPWCIITDLHMPEMDGFEFLQRYEAIAASGPVSPVIVATSVMRSADLDRCRQYGCVLGTITKPLVSETKALSALLARIDADAPSHEPSSSS